MKYATRREALGKSLQLGAAVALPLVESGVKAESLAADRGLKIIVAGGHPNDPETGCGGTIARFSDLGHEVVVLYLTRGERGIKGKSYDEAGTIRTAEAQKACEILKARPLFAGQVNGRVEVLRPTFDGGEPSAASRSSMNAFGALDSASGWRKAKYVLTEPTTLYMPTDTRSALLRSDLLCRHCHRLTCQVNNCGSKLPRQFSTLPPSQIVCSISVAKGLNYRGSLENLHVQTLE